MLLQQNSDGSVSVQTLKGADCPRFVAVEDALQGYTVNDQYTQGNIVRYVIADPGMCLQMPIGIGVSTAVGNLMMSFGDGSIIPIGETGSLVQFVTASNSNVLTNTSTQTSFGQTYTVPLQYFQASDVWRIFAQGQILGQNGTDTITVELLLGGTVLVQTVATNIAANGVFEFDCVLTVRSIGNTGAMVVAGTKGIGAVNTANQQPFYLDGITLNTNANLTFDVKAAWNEASTADQAQLDIFEIERMQSIPQKGLFMALSAVNNVSGSGYAFVDVMSV